MTADLTGNQVSFALKELGNYRVRRAQTVSMEGPPDQISGATLLALGLRETGLKNINGGAQWVPDNSTTGGHWEATKDDKGVFQIASKYHSVELSRMPGVVENTWGPTVNGKNAMNDGYCPQFEKSLRFTIEQMHEAQAYARDHGIPEDELGRFAVAAHNSGIWGALRGYQNGDVDLYTTGGDYSAWVLRHARLIRLWLNDHPAWKVT